MTSPPTALPTELSHSESLPTKSSPTKSSLANYVELLTRYGQMRPDEARALPGFAYTSPDVLAAEEAMLRKQWLCVGREDEIPAPGDYFTTEMLSEPLLVVRGDDHAVRVLVNICRHRNMRVAEGAGNRKRFVCPYHAWCYGRDGRLLSAPRIPQTALSAAEHAGLPALAHALWNGFIYVNLDGSAPPLAPQLGGLDALLEHYETQNMHHVFVREEVWGVNWKGLVENFMEGYHLSVVHNKTLHHITPTRLCEKLPNADGYTGYKAYYPERAPARGRFSPRLDERERRCSTLFCVYPCHVASQSPSLLVYLSLQPKGVDAVKIRWGASTFEDDLAQSEIDSRIEHWLRINEEDRAKLETMQSMLYSHHTGAGPLAPQDYEGTIWDFYQYLSRHIRAQTQRLAD